jgi:group II intron reverse transcriptase/maturase
MNVTQLEYKDRKLHNEDCLPRNTAEQEEYVGVSAKIGITENNHININFQTDNLMEKILEMGNVIKAYKQVKRNKGAGGVDGMRIDELSTFLNQNYKQLLQQIRDGKYNPNPVRRVEIPKEEKGKVRELGIPTVVDRVIQQAIAQVLSPIFEEQFHDYSFGFRPNRGAHDALMACKKLADRGNVYVVDMDLERFFDKVSQSKLIEILSRTIKDGKVISLIHKYLNAGVLVGGVFHRTAQGVPQGGPLSPLLSNVMLNELDKELEKRGHEFVRYADDCMILCKSRRGANRTLTSITKFIEDKLLLKVNKEKTKVSHIRYVKFLGYGFYRYNGDTRFMVHKKSILKMKNKLRELTHKNNGWSNEFRVKRINQFVTGWVQYFKLASMKGVLKQIDEWVRRKIRAIYWKQWKKVKTRYKMIRKYNIPEWKVHELANCRKGTWRAALMLNSVFTNKEIASIGYKSFTDYYLKVCVN